MLWILSRAADFRAGVKGDVHPLTERKNQWGGIKSMQLSSWLSKEGCVWLQGAPSSSSFLAACQEEGICCWLAVYVMVLFNRFIRLERCIRSLHLVSRTLRAITFHQAHHAVHPVTWIWLKHTFQKDFFRLLSLVVKRNPSKKVSNLYFECCWLWLPALVLLFAEKSQSLYCVIFSPSEGI